MFDKDGYDYYMRQHISLERALEEIGDYRGSKEIELQMRFAEERLLARIKQAHQHSIQELNSLRLILLETTKEKEK